MNHKRLAALACAAGWVVGMAAFAAAQEVAQPAEGREVPKSKPVAAPPTETPSKWTFDLNVKYVTAYFSDGYNFGDDSPILQPQATATYKAYQQDDVTLAVFGNVWANVTDEDYGDLKYFDELDLTTGAALTKGRFTLGLQYVWYMSPANTFDDIHEVGMSVAFDDSGLCKCPLAFNPFVAVYCEFIDQDGPEGTSGEVGMEPKFKPWKDGPLTVSFPTIVGVSLDDFYFDSDGGNTFFGYGATGLTLRYDVTKHWYVTGGARYLNLWADSTQASNGGDEHEVIGFASVGLTF